MILGLIMIVFSTELRMKKVGQTFTINVYLIKASLLTHRCS